MRDRASYLPPRTSKRQPIADTMDDSFRYAGNHFANDDLVTVMKPAYPSSRSKIKQFLTTIRIVPGKNPDVPEEWDVTRLSAGRGQFGDFMQCYWAIRGGGNPPRTFLLGPRRKEYDPRCSPAPVLFNAINDAVTGGSKAEKPGWAAMIATNTGEAPIIKKPGQMYVCQCLVFEKGETIYNPPKGFMDDDKIVLMDLGWDAGNGIAQLINQRLPEGEGDPADPNSLFVLGDPIAFNQGAFFRIYPTKFPPDDGSQQPAAQAAPQRRTLTRESLRQQQSAGRGGGGEAQGRGARDSGYTVVSMDSFMGYSPDISDLQEVLYPKVRPWEELLYFPTVEEQAALICEGLNLRGECRLDVIEYAWKDHPEWMPDKDSRVWGLYVGRTTVQGSNVGPDPDSPETSIGPPRGAGNGATPAAPPPIRGLRRVGQQAAQAEELAEEPAEEGQDDVTPPFDPNTPEAAAGSAKGNALAGKLASMQGATAPVSQGPPALRRRRPPITPPVEEAPDNAPAEPVDESSDGFTEPPTVPSAESVHDKIAKMRQRTANMPKS